MTDIFISYASEDRAKAQRLAQVLERKRLAVWWDGKTPTGGIFHQVIQEALDTAKCVIVLWSKASVGSDWVIAEAEEGRKRGILQPVILEPSVLRGEVKIPLPFRMIQAADLTEWRGDDLNPEFQKLLTDVERIVSVETTSGPIEQSLSSEPLGTVITKRNRGKVLASWFTSHPDPRWLKAAPPLFRKLGIASVLVTVPLVVYFIIQSGREANQVKVGSPTPVAEPTATVSADPSTILVGDSATLTWSTTDADKVTIEPDIGVVDAKGSIQVKPASSTTYSLRASIEEKSWKTVSSSVRIYVKTEVVPISDHVVQDTRVGLMWTRETVDDQENWHDGEKYCEGLTLDKYSDWRLPAFKELELLYDPDSEATIFPGGYKDFHIKTIEGFALGTPWIWSGDKHSGKALLMDFDLGKRDTKYLQVPGMSVLCVRNPSE